MSLLRSRLSCCLTSNATGDEESLAVRNEAEPRNRRNPTDMPPKAPPPMLPYPRGALRSPLHAPAKAAPSHLFKAPPPGLIRNGGNREGGALRGPLHAPANAAPAHLFKAPPPGLTRNGGNREGGWV